MHFIIVDEADMARVELPPTAAKAGWRFNEALLRQVHKELGLDMPIRLRYASGKYTWGTHYARETYHRIVLNQKLSPAKANETLWHELCHALQSERWSKESGMEPMHFYAEEYTHPESKGEWGNTYMGNIYEKEARDFADANKERRLIT